MRLLLLTLIAVVGILACAFSAQVAGPGEARTVNGGKDAGLLDDQENKPDRPSLQEDLEKLHGTWRTGEKVTPHLELRVNVVKRDGRVEASALYLPTAYQVPIIELKEVGNARVIEHKNPARDLGLTSVPYRFDGDTLILMVSHGSLKGEHSLRRVHGVKTGVVLTPDTMAEHGFSITCRFTDPPVEHARRQPAGLVQVHVSFDAKNGPAIAKITLVDFVVRDGDRMLLSVPVRLQSNTTLNIHHYVRLSIHKDMLPKAQLALIPMGFDPLPSHLVDLGAFYKATEGAGEPGRTSR